MSAYVMCPFYETEDKSKLFCEGGVIKFPSLNDRTTWLKMHCCTWDFKICKFYNEIMKKYEE